MIAYLAGKIRLVNNDSIVVEAGGIGYQVFVGEEIIEKCHEASGKIELYTHHHQTERESSLYGFKTYDELAMFERLLKVSGVGPKAAAAILSTHSVEALRSAVLNDGVDLISEAPGVGKKVASKIIHELKDEFEDEGVATLIGEKTTVSHQAFEALLNLGYNQVEARAALRMVPKDVKSTTERVKLALKNLASHVR